jgi:hypothetical protein
MFVAELGGIVGPGLGAGAALDARVTGGLYLGVQGGLFVDSHNGYPFVGARASYRIPLNAWFYVVPSFGVARVRAIAQDDDPYRTTYQSPVSPTAGLQAAAELGHFVAGVDAQVMPLHVTKTDASGSETIEKTLVPVPVSFFVGASF